MIRDSKTFPSVIIGKPDIGRIEVDNNSQSLRIDIDIVSTLPNSLQKALDERSNERRRITIWGKDLMQAGFPDDKLENTTFFRQNEINIGRISRAKEFFENRLISFVIEEVRKESQKHYFNGKRVAFHETPITFNPLKSQFTPIPIISKDISPERVQRILYEKLPSDYFLSYQYPGEPPFFIQYQDSFFGCKSRWELEEIRQQWCIYCPEGEVITCIPAEIPGNQILRYENLAFLLDEDLNQIKSKLLYAEPISASMFLNRFGAMSKEQKSLASTIPSGPIEGSLKVSDLTDASIPVLSSGHDMKELLEEHDPSSSGDSGEQKFLDDLNRVALSNQLVYDSEDLVNFHTAIKSRALVVLAGMSGVGKSQLVINYARALGLSGENEAGEELKQFLFIPVRPHWNDDADLIGFYDAIHKVYRPAETGLVDLLIEAAKEDNEDKLYLICFDEMNLARVEHYFSQFLSLLELSKERYLTLYSERLAPEVYNRYEYPHRVLIGNNVFFVGTVNIDESSFQFSDKVLDRANVIRLKIYKSLRKWKTVYERETGKLLDERNQLSPVPGDVFSSWCNHSSKIELTDEEMDFLDDLNTALRKIDKDRVVGYRIIRQMDSYLKNIPCNAEGTGLLDRGKAFDLQLVQRILTKIKGPESDLEQLFGKYVGREQAQSQILQLFEKYQTTVSAFSYSRDVCHKKAKELLDHGYAS